MKLTAIDVAAVVMAITLAALGHYADVHVTIFVGGAWAGAFLFKLGYIAEQKWGKPL